MNSKRYPCRWDAGCRSDATCLGRLYVSAHPLSVNDKAEPVTVMLGLPLCDVHFRLLDAKAVLSGERGAQIRAAVELEFRKRNALPDFSRAAIGRISDTDLDFGRFEVMNEKVRAN